MEVNWNTGSATPYSKVSGAGLFASNKELSDTHLILSQALEVQLELAMDSCN